MHRKTTDSDTGVMRKWMELLLGGSFSPEISLLRNCELGTLTLRKGNPWLAALADDKDVGDTMLDYE